MALYKIDRSRTISYKGKFKFDYTIDLTSSGAILAWTSAFYSRGAYIEFKRGDEFTAQCIVANTDPATPVGTATFTGHPFDGGAGFGGIFYNFQTNSYEVRLHYRIKGKNSFPGYFVLSNQSPPNSNDQVNSGGDGFKGTGFIRTIRGSIEGFFFDNDPLDEYVEVAEYYPSEVKTRPGNCPGSLDEFWVNKDLDENTVRQWPKYTTLNWFETTNPKGKRTVGIVAFHTDSKNNTSKFTATYNDSPSFFVSYTTTKQLNAWSQDDTSNSGYIIFSSNLEYNQPKIIPARTDSVTVDLDNFNITVAPKGYSRQAQIYVTSDPPRNVTFESVVKDWDQNHTDELTAYLVGFDSDGVNKVYDELGNEHPAPTYKKVTTNSGIFSADQTYIFYENPSIRAREEGQDNSGVVPKSFNNTQRWIFGMIDGSLTKDTFDDLESPSKHYDYPDKWVTRLSLGGYYCVNINQLSQDLTIDENDLPSGTNSIPIPLRGWKFNAMSLVQKATFAIPGAGNIRDFSVLDNTPKYYGNLNLSGYRYLDINLKSKINTNQKLTFKIIETSKGPTTIGNGFNLLDKSWDLNTSSNVFEKIRIDLCNPDNKTENVDNQDSPYPRLNTYTTSRSQNLSAFGYLSEFNKPKENKLVTKPNINTESKNWINKSIADKIGQSGIIYIIDPSNGYIDYFEVDGSKLPKSDAEATNIIYGKPRVYNGKVKLAKYWNGQEAENDPSYRKILYLYIPKNDLTKGKTIEQLLEADKNGKYPKEFQLFNYDSGYPDVTEKLSTLIKNYVDNQTYIYLNKISIYENNEIVPYDAIILVDNISKVTRKYEIIQYVNNVQDVSPYVLVKQNSTYDQNLIFYTEKTDIFLGFLAPESDDKFRTGYVKFDSIIKLGNIYQANIEYFKYELTDNSITEGIPVRHTSLTDYNYFSNDTPVISLEAPRLVEYDFPINSSLKYNITSDEVSQNEVNAIDDYPEDESTNQLYYGVSRVKEINIDNENAELGDIELVRNNSISNFIYSGNSNTFEAKTKFIVAENSNTGVPTETTYYTRRFWQQNTDARDEEEGDISWQFTKSETLNNWQLFPKTISELCDDINKVDVYVAPRWLNSSNPSSEVVRHPGWTAQKVNKGFSSQTRLELKESFLDPEYLNSDTGYATWIFGGGMLAVPSGKNSGSGTSYIKAIDISFNDMKTILAQTIFHRINGDFPPGKPDLFGNTSLINKDGTKQESTLHLRGGSIARGPGYGLILPPQKSTPDNLRKANLIEASTRENKGSSESDIKGYFETGSVYGKNKVDHYIELEKSKNFTTPSDFRSSTRNMSQSKRERASYKGGKQNIATNLSACESGFEKSIVIAYTIPTTKPGEENQTAIITTDSFFTQQYEKYPVGYNTVTGAGVTIKGEFPFVLGSETHINQTSRVNTFLFTERNSSKTATNSHYFESLIAANTDMRNKRSWYPFIDGQAKVDANFSTLSKAFKGTKYNSYTISDQATQIFNVGYADPGAIVFRSISLSTTNINAPVTDKTIFIDGVAPTYISDFRLLEPITSSGTAYSSFPTVAQISSRDYIVAYSLNASPRTINFKIISNYQAQVKNTLFDLDALTGNTLSDKYNIYGLSSDYDEKLGLHRSVFWCNGGIYYFEYALSSSTLGSKRSDKLHLVKGKLDENLVTELKNRRNIVTYFESNSELNAEVPKQKPAIITCKKQEYDGKVFVAYDTGKCYIEAVLFHPYSNILATRKFDIECVNYLGSNIKDTTPIADIQANPTSGQSALLVNFLSTNSYDPGGSTLTYIYNFGDETQSTEENPAHTFVNITANPIEFKVTLIVTNASGISSAPATITITVNPAPVNNLLPQAKFSATPTSGDVALTVTFTDQSNSANDGSFIQIYEWDFGDGNTAIKFDNSPFIYDYLRSGSFIPTLKVKDNLARISIIFTGPTITVNGVVNNPPSPSFNSVQTSFTPTLKVQFTDTSSDFEGPLVAWHWEFGDTQTADVQNPEHIYAAPGTYLVVLTVTDSGGLQVSGTKQVTVLPPGNNPPIANFNYSQQNRKLVIDFTDTSTDTDGTIISWSWDFGDNSTDTVQNPSHAYALAGTYGVILNVTDNGGKSNSITTNVVVSPLVNQAPIISNITGVQTSFKPLIVKFTETSSDTDGFITQWNWNFGDGKTFLTTDSALKNPTNTYLFPGEYTVVLTVTDDGLPDGTNKKTATSSIKFIVAPPPANQPPVALFAVNTNNILAPATISFTDGSTDSDGRIVSWLWEFETGNTLFFNVQTYQKIVSYTFTKSGTYPVKLTVTDDGSLTNTYILDIIVKNNPPVAIFSASPNPVLSKTQVNFFGNNSYDTDGNITKYAWDFGDGTIISQGRTTEFHTYAKPGTYNASLTVTDNIGDSATENLPIIVTNRNPVARITYTTLTVKAPGSLTFNGDISTDEDGSIASYSWSVSNTVLASTPNATINFSTQGTYIVFLTVTDDFGATNTASVTVNVSAPDNILPIAILNVDKNSGVINDTFVFNVSNSYDPDGSIILYQLDFGDGTSTQFVNPAPISHIYKTVGVFTAKLIVTDNRNGVSLETTSSVQVITINNQPPVASFSYSPIGAFTFDPIIFTDNSSDPENALSRWYWEFGDGTTFTTTDLLQKNPTKSYNKGNKNYTVSLTVYDNFQLPSTTSQIVHINNRKPFAVIATSSVPSNNIITGSSPFTVTFDSNSYDLDGTVVNYEWYLNGLVGTPLTTKSFTYTFSSPRFIPYTVTLKVQDDDGDWSDVANIGVKVNFPNIPPVAVISANPSSNTSLAPVTVSFSAAGSYDPDNVGGPLIYAWDFGNGSVSEQANPITNYTKPGTYKVSLTVTDIRAATNTATLDYIVKNSKPVALLDTLPSGITQLLINTSVTLTSQGSYDIDPDQFVNGYKWLIDGINQNSNTPTLSTSFSTIGNHVVTLSVFDNLGLESDPVSKTIVVVSAPPPPPINKNPIAILGNEPTVTGYIELKVGDSYTFNGTTSYDPEDGSNITFEWAIDGVKSGYSSTFVNQFNTIGIFTISLAVFDTQQLSSTPATNLDKRYSIDVNVTAVLNPLANKLFSSGQALYGAIASGSNTPNRYGFQLVDDTKQYTIIESGLYHTFVVDADGKLYASGSNSNGQLGFSSNITQLDSLTLVPLASKYKVVKVSAGDYCSAIIAEDILINKRVLLVCGSNIYGIFGQTLPFTNIYNFQPILERTTSSNSLLDVSCNNAILAFIDNRQVWVSGLHNYTNKTGVNDTGFFPINIDPNPDLLIGSTNYLNPFKLEVGFKGTGFVTGISYDVDSQIVWFTGLSSLRGWGYAYDISTYENTIIIIGASQDATIDRAIYIYNFDLNETPVFIGASETASFRNPGESFIKISTGAFGFLALSQNKFYPYGDNSNGALGYAASYTNSKTENAKNNLKDYVVLPTTGVVEAYDISAGGNHSIILASNVKPTGNNFIIIRPNGYPSVDKLTIYPTTQGAN